MSERNRARRSRRQPHNVITGQNVHINSFYKASNFCNTKVDKLVVKKLSLFGGSGSDKVKPGLDETYFVKCGILLIFNQINFEPSNEGSKEKLPDRDGTMKDEMKLEEVFSDRGFLINKKRNSTSVDMIATIEKMVKKCRTYDSLIVCILSHGYEGSVYGSDSKPVSLRHIEQLMSCADHMRGKPKILIVQACQGDKFLPNELKSASKLVSTPGHPSPSLNHPSPNISQSELKSASKTVSTPEHSHIQHDGIFNRKTLEASVNSSKKAPIYGDFCIAIATIPGFAAIRNTEEGSWFIQALCDVIEKEGHRKHFTEIMRKVNKKVTDQQATFGCMVPKQDNRLSKDYYLPKKRNAHPSALEILSQICYPLRQRYRFFKEVTTAFL